MNLQTLLIGLISFVGGLIGVVWNSRRSAMEKKNTGWTYSITNIIFSSWALVIVGALLIILGLFGKE